MYSVGETHKRDKCQKGVTFHDKSSKHFILAETHLHSYCTVARPVSDGRSFEVISGYWVAEFLFMNLLMLLSGNRGVHERQPHTSRVSGCFRDMFFVLMKLYLNVLGNLARQLFDWR